MNNVASLLHFLAGPNNWGQSSIKIISSNTRGSFNSNGAFTKSGNWSGTMVINEGKSNNLKSRNVWKFLILVVVVDSMFCRSSSKFCYLGR